MNIWEPLVSNKEIDLKWTGDKGFIILNKPIFTRGLRLIMRSAGRYIGFTGFDVYEETMVV